MDTKVVNVKVKYIRPTYKNLKEWMLDSGNVYIGALGFFDPPRVFRILTPGTCSTLSTACNVTEIYEGVLPQHGADQALVHCG